MQCQKAFQGYTMRDSRRVPNAHPSELTAPVPVPVQASQHQEGADATLISSTKAYHPTEPRCAPRACRTDDRDEEHDGGDAGCQVVEPLLLVLEAARDHREARQQEQVDEQTAGDALLAAQSRRQQRV